MELGSYLRSSRKITALLVVLPLLVGAATAAYLSQVAPQTYRASLSIRLPAAQAAFQTEQLADDFATVTRSQQVLSRVAREAGVDTARVREALGVRRVSSASSYLEVTITDEDAALAERLASAVTVVATDFFLQPQIEAARQSYIELARQYQRLARDPAFPLNPVPADATAVTGGFSDSETLQRRQELVLQKAAEVNLTLVSLRAQLATIVSNSSSVSVERVERNGPIVRGSLVNAGASLFLLIALVACVEWTRAARRPERPGDPRSPRPVEVPAGQAPHDLAPAYGGTATSG